MPSPRDRADELRERRRCSRTSRPLISPAKALYLSRRNIDVTSIAARCRHLLAGLTTAALLVVPASANAAGAPAPGCPEVPVAQPFAPWNDTADYFLAPDGGLEANGAGWTLQGGAAVVAGNEPFKVVAPSDSRSLRLAPGDSATTAPFCIGAEHRSMRFFANAARASSMDVDVLYQDAGGQAASVRIASLAGEARWAPTGILAMIVNESAPSESNAMNVRLRFTPRGWGAWTIDDVHIDPFRSR
jgi:hypothetical protein